MERVTKKEKEYKDVIEQQKEQILRYEKKLRDVVHAYKGIQKEKEALEASLKALMETANSSIGDNLPVYTGVDIPIDQSAHGENSENAEERGVIRQLKAQLSTLSESLATITAEKSRSEANFQQDRKRLLQEKEILEKSVAAAYNQAEIASQTFKQQVSELKSNLSIEKAERSRESTNNQVILRELQKTISEERQKRESLELELNNKSKLSQVASVTTNQLEVAERKLRDLSNELESTKMKLFTAEQKLQQPSTHLLQLQNEMVDLKIQHRLAIQQEQHNAAEAKEEARQLAQAHDKRVASLEARLAEFSERIGSYDRLRQQDLATVSKLKEQLNDIHKNPSQPSNHNEEEYDIGKLIEKITSLKNRLIELSQRSNIAVNIAAVFDLDGESSRMDNHEACQLELEQLKQELEWFKREEKNGTRKTATVQSPLQEEVNQMRVQIQFLRDQMEHNEQEHRDSLRSVQESWIKERTSWKDELAQIERSYRARIADLEQQLQKQRERSLTLLQEKDEELVSLRELLNMKNMAPLSPTSVSQQKETDSKDEWPESLAPLASMTLGASASGGQILHYVEELARKEGEIMGLRRSKNQLEASLREMQMAFVTMEHKVAEQKQHLHEELARLERNQSREGANLEYLKNVLLEFVLRSDPSSQSHMFNAIAACLHFSPKEIQRVRLQHPKWKLNANASAAASYPLPPSS
uniref:EOG090X04IO n=1 Tax=Simocephalus serrulatus TaxID=117539 RepID=A0A4Y7NLP7_9CRUS|nr:EOG090X04IO [Simocephalus serrulatus]SVE94179.1 EOG090X04IO [Simocephalus serrulatus]